MPNFRQHTDAVAHRAEVPAVVTGKVLRAHLEEVTQTLAADDRVVLTGFGTFRMLSGKPVFVPSDALISALADTQQDSGGPTVP